jgi:hypothetical protein
MPNVTITDDMAARRVGLDDASNEPEWTGAFVWRFRYRTRYGWRGWRTHLARRKRQERLKQRDA